MAFNTSFYEEKNGVNVDNFYIIGFSLMGHSGRCMDLKFK